MYLFTVHVVRILSSLSRRFFFHDFFVDLDAFGRPGTRVQSRMLAPLSVPASLLA